MKIKSDSGVTLAVLVVTIVVIAIISAISVQVGFQQIDLARFENLKTNLLLIQSRCKIKAEQKAIGEIEESELYGTKQENAGEYDGWYLLSQDDLNNMGVTSVKADDQYYVNYDSDDIAYGKGLEFDGKTYHKLSEVLEY